jgi:hypothetical protein
VETLRSTPAAAYEESGTVLRRDAGRASAPPPLPSAPRSEPQPRGDSTRRTGSERLPALERKPVLLSPVSSSSKPAARPRSTPAAPAAPKRPWVLYLGLCLIVGYCAHLLLGS